MSSPSFALFPDFPPEIRHQIWVAALPQPRFVALRQVIPKSGGTYIKCSTPIPALLQTTRESRTSMQHCGYKIAFTNLIPGRGVSINFQHDILFLGSRPWIGGPILRSEDYAWNIQAMDFTELRQVERVAVQEIKLHHQPLWNIVSMMPRLRGMFLVPSLVPGNEVVPYDDSVMYGSRDIWETHKEAEHDLWGYLECETMECSEGHMLGSSEYGIWHVYYQRMWSYKRAHDGSSVGFFEFVEEAVRAELRRRKGEEEGSWNVPDVRIVHLVTREKAKKIVEGRERLLLERREREWVRRRKRSAEGPEYEPVRRRGENTDEDEVEVMREWGFYE